MLNRTVPKIVGALLCTGLCGGVVEAMRLYAPQFHRLSKQCGTWGQVTGNVIYSLVLDGFVFVAIIAAVYALYQAGRALYRCFKK